MKCRVLAPLALAVMLLLSSIVRADDLNTITGKISIDYQTRVRTDDSGNPLPGVKDKYSLDLSVGNLTVLRGQIDYTPTLTSAVVGRETQPGSLQYNLGFLIRNPRDLTQTKSVGRLVGLVPIDGRGVYRFDDGTLRVAIETTGKMDGFESKFRGLAAGKPPTTNSLLERVKKQAITITKQVNGKALALAVTNYDKMSLSNLVLAAGPMKAYPEATVNGDMLYDYDRSAWAFNNATINYSMDGKQISDKLSGTIRWVEAPNRATTGDGQYEFDVRVNAPEVGNTEAAVFDPQSDESAFFDEPDSTLSALIGTAKYKDTCRGGCGEDGTVTSSVVDVALRGNNLTQQQRLALTKLIWLVGVVPMNAE